MSIRFPFDEKKSAQAAAHLIARHGGTLNYMVLIKLLYLADRESLLAIGKTITGDQPFSMPHGPVLSRILDLISMGQENVASPWFEYVTEPQNYNVRTVSEKPDNSELSEFEIEVLDRIDSQFGNLNKWGLRDLTHMLPEWEDPNGSSVPIFIETILRAASKSSEEIERIASNAQEEIFFRSLER